MGFKNVVFLPTELVFTPHFLIIVIEVQALDMT